ncbi:hypothetical protein RRG08_060355 [Elysia crispata]|uniref:Uncharacterized protein n=1 Tax=Elysia crispata TaxID=231223 RepID=A0AAE0ZGD5_9GAST|nr:hypothetical protein RRG08_060355 [Elysia crispata]
MSPPLVSTLYLSTPISKLEWAATSSDLYSHQTVYTSYVNLLRAKSRHVTIRRGLRNHFLNKIGARNWEGYTTGQTRVFKRSCLEKDHCQQG